jgi:hypothetical protein
MPPWSNAILGIVEKSKTRRRSSMKRKLNIPLLISLVIGVAYLIYSVVYWSGAVGGTTTGTAAAGAAIASALVMPHLVCLAVGIVFNALGLFMRKAAFALVGAILYAVALVLFIPYFMFVIVEMILSFVGFSQLKKGESTPAA